MSSSRIAKEALYALVAQVAQAVANPHRLELLDLFQRSLGQLREMQEKIPLVGVQTHVDLACGGDRRGRPRSGKELRGLGPGLPVIGNGSPREIEGIARTIDDHLIDVRC